MPFAMGSLASGTLPKKSSKSDYDHRKMPDPNMELPKKVAKRLGPFLNEVVCDGGCTAGLVVVDAAAADVRPTFAGQAYIESRRFRFCSIDRRTRSARNAQNGPMSVWMLARSSAFR